MGALRALYILGLDKFASINLKAMAPASSTPAGIHAAEQALAPLKSVPPIVDPVKAQAHSALAYQGIMGKPMYRWPASSKELNYRLQQQIPENLRTPLNYAV
jgi:hypothetical protein